MWLSKWLLPYNVNTQGSMWLSKWPQPYSVNTQGSKRDVIPFLNSLTKTLFTLNHFLKMKWGLGTNAAQVETLVKFIGLVGMDAHKNTVMVWSHPSINFVSKCGVNIVCCFYQYIVNAYFYSYFKNSIEKLSFFGFLKVKYVLFHVLD